MYMSRYPWMPVGLPPRDRVFQTTCWDVQWACEGSAELQV